MNKTTYLLFCITISFLILLPVEVFCQRISKKSKSNFDKALSIYQSGDLMNAKVLALQSVKHDSLNIDAFLLLVDISAEQQNMELQQWALEKVITINRSKYPLAFKMLSEIYYKRGDYKRALETVKTYGEFTIKYDSAFVAQMIDKCIQAERLMEQKHQMEIIHFDDKINTSENEYWPFISADDSTLYFTRLITSEQRFHFERLFVSERTDDSWQAAQKLSMGSSDEVNEGTMSLSADGRLFFYTSCGQPEGLGSCDIYYMVKDNGKWHNPVNAGPVVNTNRWEAQPAVSAYGDKLFWTSNREGGVGGKDIWYAPILKIENGKIEFGNPVNPGWGVNTSYDDYSPFIHADNVSLYFASEGHYGLGGADMYLSRYMDEKWQAAQNLGFPINSRANDDGLVVSPTAHIAVFSSNREGAKARSKDLYLMQLPDKLMPQKMGYVKGFVFDAINHQKLDAQIELTNIDSKQLQHVKADAHDGYLVTLANNNLYAFNVSKPGYLFYSEHFDHVNPEGFKDASVFNIYLHPIDINAKVILNNIFFDHDSYLLKEESKIELQKVVSFLKTNPTVKVEIAGHTDNTGNDTYNLLLSENRAKAIAIYLQNSIESSRINYKGYGANNPVSDNSTELGRSENRRSELVITAF